MIHNLKKIIKNFTIYETKLYSLVRYIKKGDKEKEKTDKNGIHICINCMVYRKQFVDEMADLVFSFNTKESLHVRKKRRRNDETY